MISAPGEAADVTIVLFSVHIIMANKANFWDQIRSWFKRNRDTISGVGVAIRTLSSVLTDVFASVLRDFFQDG